MSEMDPSEFVQRIRQLGEQRDQQDAERVKKLEEELLAGRSERLARRAERARSISPDKPYTPQSPRSAAANTPRSVQDKAASTPTPVMNPPPAEDDAREETLQRLTSSPAPMTLEDTEPKKPAPSAAALGRSGTLSWKQRPQSGSLRRPLSMSPTRKERPDFSSPPEPSSPEANPSRSSIAASLGSKDPTWFRQTPDRGAGSAAYRKSQEESASDAGSISGRRQLPGMSRESTIEPEISSPPSESVRSSSPGSRGGSVRGSAMLSNRFSSNTSISGGDADALAKTRSPLPVLESQKFAPPSEPASSVGDVEDARATARGLAMSPTQGRISPERERSTSPTKGMGGFVQSAMLKRSDSVSKRWSTQTPPGLTRQNSTLSNRGSAMAGYGSLSRNERPPTLSRDNSIEPSSRPASRPTSSHSNATITRDTEPERKSRDEFVKPALPLHSRSKSVASTFSEKDQTQDETSPPSPSKRWSPTKSSWLESALNKPDSPKPKQAPPAQPSWMAEINRLKQQKSSVDLGKGGSPFQNASSEPFGSGRISPSKDMLRPAGLRRGSSPRKDESAKADIAEASAALPLRSKPVVLPKPTGKAEGQVTPADDPPEKIAEEEESKQTIDAPAEDAPSRISTESEAPATTAKEPPSVATKPVTSRFPPVKPKPETAQKIDFRAGLKSRSTAGDAGRKEEVNELQSVFGKLRKAETKNYVAPDVLKDNITRGKNALNVTGGPKPTVRRDEFRESLKSKKSMILEKAEKEGTALKRSDSSSEPAPTPEAIARRSVLNRADSGSKSSDPPKMQQSTPEALARKKSLRSIRPEADSKPAQTASAPAMKEPAMSGKLAGRFNPALAGMLARGPPAMAANKSASSADVDGSSARPTQDEKTGPAPELQHMTKGRARGPKRRAPAKQASTESETKQEKVTTIVTSVPLVKPEHVLPSSISTEANGKSERSSTPIRTLARQSLTEKPATPAKSPRIASGNFGSLNERSASPKPVTPAKSPRIASGNFEKSATPDLPKKPSATELERRASGVHTITTQSPRPESISSPKPASPSVPKKPTSFDNDRRISASHVTPQKSPLPKSVETPNQASPTPSPIIGQSRFSRPLPMLPTKPESPKPSVSKETALPNVEISPAKEEDTSRQSAFASVKNATTMWGKQSTSSPTPVRTPIKLPTKADEEAAMRDAGLNRSPRPESKELPQLPPTQPDSPHQAKPQPPKPKPVGLGFSLGSLSGLVASRSRESTPVPAKAGPLSPPTSANRPQSEPLSPSTKPAKPDGMFADFFEEAPVTEASLADNINTEQILRSPPLDLGPSGKIRTLRKTIQEVDGFGKIAAVPAHEEHILFQDSMYLCSHVYGDAKGAKFTDVYHWVGNGVSESTLEDAQLFAKNFARQNQGRFLTVRQGQESPNFFDALGGIVITRRGSNPASKEFLLCGRRHLGHLAFDEVDFSLKSLCSAFPYLVSMPSGSLGMTKVYLWKGRGCSAEELSGARLMGMDLAPSGDFNEIDEGAEPQDFINIFPQPATPSKGPLIPRSADHWRYKASSDKYRVRLFKVEQSSGAAGGWGQALQTPLTPKSPASLKTEIKEIMPFSQRDLEPEHVYVLDAFFEMYIIVGSLSHTQAQAFSTALLFSQEYGMLAVSEEDRPFMPVTTVVLEGVPRDMKAVFRHWDDTNIPAAGLMRGKLGRGKSLRIVGLEKAIEATRR